MPLILGSAFLAGALLSAVLPISLLIAFATFFVRSIRRLPPNAGASDPPQSAREGQAGVQPPAMHQPAAHQPPDLQA